MNISKKKLIFQLLFYTKWVTTWYINSIYTQETNAIPPTGIIISIIFSLYDLVYEYKNIIGIDNTRGKVWPTKKLSVKTSLSNGKPSIILIIKPIIIPIIKSATILTNIKIDTWVENDKEFLFVEENLSYSSLVAPSLINQFSLFLIHNDIITNNANNNGDLVVKNG